MSHQHERREKKCLNCGADLYDRFCHKCGQENVEPRQSFWQLTVHFFEDLTHFDGKFFTTVKYMFTKPGFLTSEYVNGKRAAYVNPIRMYLFVSAMFFILFGMLSNNNEEAADVKEMRALTDSLAAVSNTQPNTDTLHADSTVLTDLSKVTLANKNSMNAQSVADYDSIQNSLSPEKRDGFIRRYFLRRLAATREKSHNVEDFLQKVRDKIIHSIPAVLFFSVPLIALVLQLLYIRRRKEYYYVGHIIFLTHYYCFAFIAILLLRASSFLAYLSTAIQILIVTGTVFYLYKSMRGYYKQKRFKTFIKFLLLLFFGFFTLFALAVIAIVNSVLNVAAH